jgi:hypothetical protein
MVACPDAVPSEVKQMLHAPNKGWPLHQSSLLSLLYHQWVITSEVIFFFHSIYATTILVETIFHRFIHLPNFLLSLLTIDSFLTSIWSICLLFLLCNIESEYLKPSLSRIVFLLHIISYMLRPFSAMSGATIINDPALICAELIQSGIPQLANFCCSFLQVATRPAPWPPWPIFVCCDYIFRAHLQGTNGEAVSYGL